MLTKESALFYWDALYGPEPVVGGDPVHSRDSAAWYFDGRFFRKQVTTPDGKPGPRFESVDLDGGEKRPIMVVELARAGEVDGPTDFSAGGPWPGAGEFTVAEVKSIMGGEVGWRHTNLGNNSSRSRTQAAGALTGSQETIIAIVENVDAVSTALGIRDTTISAFTALGSFTWATGEFQIGQGGGIARARKLADVGPNGGPVYLLQVTATGTASNLRSAYLYPTGTSQNTDSVIIHYVNLEEGAFGSSPIVGPGGTVRLADSFAFPDPPRPQGMAIMTHFIERGTVLGPAFNSILWQIGANANPSLLQYRGATSYRLHFHNGVGANSVELGGGAPAYGDQVRLVAVLDSDGKVYLAMRIASAAATDTVVTGALALPSDWAEPVWNMIATSASIVGGAGFLRLVAVRLGDLDAPTDGTDPDALIDELDAYQLGPGGELVAA